MYQNELRFVYIIFMVTQSNDLVQNSRSLILILIWDKRLFTWFSRVVGFVYLSLIVKPIYRNENKVLWKKKLRFAVEISIPNCYTDIILWSRLSIDIIPYLFFFFFFFFFSQLIL